MRQVQIHLPSGGVKEIGKILRSWTWLKSWLRKEPKKKFFKWVHWWFILVVIPQVTTFLLSFYIQSNSLRSHRIHLTSFCENRCHQPASSIRLGEMFIICWIMSLAYLKSCDFKKKLKKIKKEKKAFCPTLPQNCLFLVWSEIILKIVILKHQSALVNYVKYDKYGTSMFFLFFAIADLKKFSWCNVIQQRRNPSPNFRCKSGQRPTVCNAGTMAIVPSCKTLIGDARFYGIT